MFHRDTVARTVLTGALTIAVALAVNSARTSAKAAGDLIPGKVELKSAGALAFGPNGVLFVADSAGGAVVALDTNDHTAAPGASVRQFPGRRRKDCRARRDPPRPTS